MASAASAWRSWTTSTNSPRARMRLAACHVVAGPGLGSVFTVLSVRILPGADSPARREVLLCSCKEVPKKHARLPRPRPAARAGVSLAPRVFAGGAELAAPSAPLRHPAPRLYLESSRENPLRSARRQRGDQGQDNGHPDSPTSGGWLGLHTSWARSALGRCVPRLRRGRWGLSRGKAVVVSLSATGRTIVLNYRGFESRNVQGQTCKRGHSGPFASIWRRGRDSNPRYGVTVYTLSRRAPSTARPPLRFSATARRSRSAKS